MSTDAGLEGDLADLTPEERAEVAAFEAARRDRGLAWLLVVTGVVGFVAAFTLLVERIELLQNPDYLPSCSINPILSCGSVMVTEQASLFGFPNPIIGVGAFPVVVAVGAGVLAGAAYARWFWAGLQVGVSLAAVFIAWLISQSLYEINALCPYCMVVWAVVIPLFWKVTQRNVAAGVLGGGLSRSGVSGALNRWSVLLIVVTYLVVILLILQRFWNYWSTLL